MAVEGEGGLRVDGEGVEVVDGARLISKSCVLNQSVVGTSTGYGMNSCDKGSE